MRLMRKRANCFGRSAQEIIRAPRAQDRPRCSTAGCTFRGHVTALDANTGKKLWTTFVIPTEPKPRGQNKQGVTLYGPAGGSVWNAPTVDPKRHRIYVGT